MVILCPNYSVGSQRIRRPEEERVGRIAGWWNTHLTVKFAIFCGYGLWYCITIKMATSKVTSP